MNVLHRNCKTDIKEFLHVIVTQLLAPDLKEKVQKVCKYYAHKSRKAFFPDTSCSLTNLPSWQGFLPDEHYLGLVTSADNGSFLMATTSVMNFANRIILIGIT